MSSVKYTKVSIEDPDDGLTSAFNFNSVFTYDRPDYFSYGKPSKEKYRSAFTYEGLDTSNTKQTTNEPPASASVVCQVWAAAVTLIFYLVVFVTLPISYFFAFKRISQYERLVVYRLGRLLATKGPGTVIILPLIDSFTRVDLRVKAFSIPPLTIVTSDESTIEVGAEVFHHVKDAMLVINNLKDLDHGLRNVARSCMQRLLGRHKLRDVQSPPNKRTLQIDLVKSINETAMPWGIEVTTLEMSNIRVLGENAGVMQHQSPAQVLKTMLGAHTLDGSDNPLQQMASQFLSQIPGGDQMLQSIQPHLQGTPAASGDTRVDTLVNIDKEEARFHTAQDLLDAVQPHLSAKLVAQFGVVYKFVVEGQNGGVFHLDLKNGNGSASTGEPLDTADVTLTLSSDDLCALLQGEMTTASAYMSGRLRVEGDTGVASQLSDLINLVKRK